jgi:NAD(P)H-flavin reductase
MAGGLGLAALRSLVYALIQRRQAFGRVVVLVGGRTPQALLFPRELARWRSRFDLEVRATVDAGDPKWKGDIGVVTTLLPRATFAPENATAFVCGPEVMMRFAAADLVARGVPAGRVFVSMERNMKCAVAVCGHCQFGPSFVCVDGPVFPYSRVEAGLRIREM